VSSPTSVSGSRPPRCCHRPSSHSARTGRGCRSRARWARTSRPSGYTSASTGDNGLPCGVPFPGRVTSQPPAPSHFRTKPARLRRARLPGLGAPTGAPRRTMDHPRAASPSPIRTTLPFADASGWAPALPRFASCPGQPAAARTPQGSPGALARLFLGDTSLRP